jgi:cytochrome c553
MKKVTLLTLLLLAFATFAMAQNFSPSTDVLGAHLNYGRGCTACHAPHSGARGSGIATTDTTTGNVALWGQDVAPLFGKTIITGQDAHGGSYPETLPSSFNAGTPDVGGILTCLSCHDGNWAKGAMMQNKVYETVPGTYASNNIPTLLGNDGNGQGDYLNDHPVGLNAAISCGGNYDWDCTIVSGAITYPAGTKMYQFVQNYGFFVSPAAYNGKPVVLCTTCHNQHLMNVVKVTNGPKSGLASGYYQTMFFVRAPYNPGSTTTGSNQTAQFCRQCHGGEANEMNNGKAVTIF